MYHKALGVSVQYGSHVWLILLITVRVDGKCRVKPVRSILSPPAPRYLQILFISPDGGSGYRIDFPRDAPGQAKADTRTVPSSPYEGLAGLITPYPMSVTASTTTNSEVRMQRTLQTVAVPVFQFGIFSDTDLSVHAGPDFNFGGWNEPFE